MALWGKTVTQNNAPKFKPAQGHAVNEPGTGNLYANVTSGAFVNGAVLAVVGANGTGESAAAGHKIAHAGWQLSRRGTGPVLEIIVNDGGSGYGNLAAITVSNGTVNASALVATTNSTGGIQTITVIDGGRGFINSSAVGIIDPANAISTVTIGGGSGYVNGEIITASNGEVNATGTITTNSTGGIVSVTWENRGRGFSNTLNTVITIDTVGGTNGNVTANSLYGGTGANLSVVLGGRAGRVHYETLVSMGQMIGNNATALP